MNEAASSLLPQPPAPGQIQRVAVIDLGSNTARVIVMNAITGYSYRLEDEIREVVRLRQGMTGRRLSEAAIARGLFTLQLFRQFCDSVAVDRILAVATSAVREARNRRQFVARARREAGISLRVISGEQEAYYGSIGVLNEVPLESGYILDIGGGSAQVSQIAQGRYRRGKSLPLGTLALTEKFIRSDPPDRNQVEAIRHEIDQALSKIKWLKAGGRPLVGIGGTIRNLAKIDAARTGYPLNTLRGYVLSRASVAESIELFRSLPNRKRQDIRGLSADRADIILPGALVLLALLDRLNLDQFTVSESGLREGVFFEHFWAHLKYPVISDVRLFSVLNLARQYHYHQAHADHVRFLSGRLFDQMIPLHGLGPAERRLLDAAALLHDLGTIISYDDHHKHSQTLIENAGLPGFSPREVAMIALLTRYHRKGTPDIAPYGVLLRDADRVPLTRLASILRLAEFLERGRSGMVTDVQVSWDDRTLHIKPISDRFPAVEIWEARRLAAPLVEQAFGRHVSIESSLAGELDFAVMPAWQAGSDGPG